MLLIFVITDNVISSGNWFVYSDIFTDVCDCVR